MCMENAHSLGVAIMYHMIYSEYLDCLVRIYGPHAYVYKPEDNNKHNINGWVPIQVPVNKLSEG